MADSGPQYAAVIANLTPVYNKGRASGDLSFFASTTSIHNEDGIEFEIRLCPSLAAKEKEHREDYAPTTANMKINPFLPPYKEGLFLGDITESESFVALLNKYSVVEHHFLLVTKEFRLQTSPLTPAELTTAYKLLSAAKNNARSLFMFFNCGPNSGSSQGHKHLQFLPLSDPNGPPIEKLARRQKVDFEDKPFSIQAVPFANHIIRLPSDLSGAPFERISDVLQQSYIKLLDLTIQTFMHRAAEHKGPTAYNVIMTLNHLYMVPRGKADYVLANGDVLPVNSLGFAGLLLVKSEPDGEALRKEGVLNVLKGVGLPDAHGQSCAAVESHLS